VLVKETAAAILWGTAGVEFAIPVPARHASKRPVFPRFRPPRAPVLRSHRCQLLTFRNDTMRYRLGRFLQLLGLCIAPSGLAGNVLIEHVVREREILIIAAAGVSVFLLGWLIQGKK
jgi:hypothetical protein